MVKRMTTTNLATTAKTLEVTPGSGQRGRTRADRHGNGLPTIQVRSFWGCDKLHCSNSTLHLLHVRRTSCSAH